MKPILTVACLCVFLVGCVCSVSANGADELHLRVALVTGERSRDSGSNTTTITVERNVIVWEKTSSRERRMGKPASRKEFKLSPADKGGLLKLIGASNLLVTDSIELPPDSSYYRYFRISVDLTLDEKKGAINISGPRTGVAVKEEKLYQNTVALVKELYRIMNTQDTSVHFEELILNREMTGQTASSSDDEFVRLELIHAPERTVKRLYVYLHLGWDRPGKASPPHYKENT